MEGDPPAAGSRVWRIAFGALLVLSVLPVWWFAIFPSQDGPSHLYNARLLTALLDPGAFQVRRFFAFNPGFHPNLLAHGLLAAFQTVLPDWAAEKTLVSLVVVLLPLSLHRLLRVVEPGREAYALVGLPFAYHHLLHLGFYSFSLSLSLCFFTLAFLWPRRARLDAKGALGLYALLALGYLAHLSGFVMTLGLAGLVFASTLLTERERPLEERVRGVAGAVAWLLPPLAVGVAYLLGGREGYVDWVAAEKLRQIFFQRMVLASYTRWQEHLAPFLWGALLVTLAWTVLERLRRREGFMPRDTFLVAAGCLVPPFFLLPRWLNSGGFVNDRLFLFLFLLAWVGSARPPRALRAVLIPVLVGCGVAHVGRLSWEYARLQPELRAAVAAADRIPPHATVDYQRLAKTSSAFDRFPRWVDPFAHVDAWYGLAYDVVLFANYETRFEYFPVRKGEALHEDPDYVVLWPLAEGDAPPKEALAGRDVAFREAGLVLLRTRRPLPPPFPVGEARALDLSALGGVTGPGWLLPGPAVALGSVVRGRRDGVYRLHLPDGPYRATLVFPPAGVVGGIVEVYVDGNRALRHRPGDGDTRAQVPFEARAGRATLVLHAPDPEAGWGLRALRVERAARAGD